jgi:hypothetical protein
MRNLTPCSHVANPPVVEPRGYVHADGDFVRTHLPEVQKVVHSEARLARQQGGGGRIVGMDGDGSGGLLVTTSTDHLAHRLGHALLKELGGEIHHGFNHRNKLAFVWWRH